MPGRGAENKARQRERNTPMRDAAGKPLTRGGSSGVSILAAGMRRKEFAEIEHVAEHVADLQALFSSGQIMANRAVTGTLVAQKEWAHEMLDAALASQGRAVYVRFYVVPLSAVLPDPEEDTP